MVAALLPFRTIDSLLRPNLEPAAGLYVIRDADEWSRQWAASPSEQLSVPPVPAVDWQTEMCVAIALGGCPSSGYSVLIDGIVVEDHGLTVVAWEIRPGPTCGTTCAITYPFHVVAAPAHPATPTLYRQIAYQDCEASGAVVDQGGRDRPGATARRDRRCRHVGEEQLRSRTVPHPGRGRAHRGGREREHR
ncbi:hypothetical protein FHR83_006114 [Actinoplanes campanulatus]|uniref:PrcB C-terminal domain-containing protein n=1 Tax=Actinoplanes campanulatus TaxID=113559 RepID=A0A7W5ALN4_9ACTN|nr:protease complex subunit PrcB family protein [Actinoplanes campanulatus]MBB3098415.1 hypothetical protein [Actinoplanes campanulatus]GGN35123.1 hypothetical protein GCM10010109_58840 [Actinoplanes campanulatus]GID39108.1 hypothetical protein Aca09nite_56140 [Actinoplanes campanulatus]